MMKNKHVNPPQPLPAATIILVRQQRSRFQVYLLKRHAKSRFMAGHYVFPGGILDAEDWNFTLWKDHVDLDSESLASQLGGGLTQKEILAYGVAAIRETLEEAGVFLANRVNQDEQDLKRVVSLRTAEDLPKEWFLNLVVSEGWKLAISALFRWRHWITPVLMKRRYDTRFLLAMMPSGQRCRADNRETTHGLWVSPKKGIVGNLSGRLPLSPPTLVTLQELLQFSTLEDLMQEAQTRMWGSPIFPRLIPLDKGAVLVEPWDAQYHQPEIGIDAAKLEKAVLPAGETFSRIWYDGRRYRPIKA